MKIVHTIKEIISLVTSYKMSGLKIGFVPTMGALHHGHLTLVQQSKGNTDVTVVSIFVNPTQFNNPSDLKNYPRTLDSDCAMLETVLNGNDIVFAPSESEMYHAPDTREFNFGKLESVMEGAFRPGHFRGVAQIVSKLFDIVKPDKAFFGEKDFQQLAVIKQLVKNYMPSLKVEIVPCPIVREDDGLAMSSRNMLLNSDQRTVVPIIYKTLSDAVLKSTSTGVGELKNWVVAQINSQPLLKTEYFEIVDDTELQPVDSWNKPCGKVGCVAVHVGKVRLIDNIRFQ